MHSQTKESENTTNQAASLPPESPTTAPPTCAPPPASQSPLPLPPPAQAFLAAPTKLDPADPEGCVQALLALPPIEPWPEPVDGHLLLDQLTQTISSFVVLPKWAAETLALWILHTYCFQLRDVTTYIGIESPEHRCGKTTLLTVLSELAHRAVVASNVSSPAFFRVIEKLQPTLLIDEADTFLQGNDELRGILNSGYHKKSSFVLRAVNEPAPAPSANPNPASQAVGLARYSVWCPKAISRIGRLPPTLADRCILIRMHRKTRSEKCERLRNINAANLQRQCARFVVDHSAAIAAARPQIPHELNDRAADIWEPLLVLADLAGDRWPALASQAAVTLAATSHDSNPIGSLLLDIYLQFLSRCVDRLFSYELVQALNGCSDRPWLEARRGRPITDLWLSQQLRPYGIRPRNLRLNGTQAKGYLLEEMMDVFRRYIPKSEARAFIDEAADPAPPSPAPPTPPDSPPPPPPAEPAQSNSSPGSPTPS